MGSYHITTPYNCFFKNRPLRGDYNSYVKTRAEHFRQRQHDYEVQQKRMIELKQYIEEAKKSDNPATVNSVASRQKMLDKEESELIDGLLIVLITN